MTACAAPSPAPGWLTAYRLRWKRRRLLWRSFRSRHQLTSLVDRTAAIKPGAILAFTTLRNEMLRLPWFLSHYRRLGIDHFLMVDNSSDDGTVEFLKEQPDVSLWQTHDSYRAARFGLDWLTWLQMRYGHRHWTLMVDVDELLIYAHHDTRSLRDLTSWLEARGVDAFGALMLDLYPKGPPGDNAYSPELDPVGALSWFDATPYRAQRQMPMDNLWVQGGMRERMFFADAPRQSPTLNKIPLVRWSRSFAYVNSCHSALPRRLNHAYDGPAGRAASGVLLHTKFLPDICDRARAEKSRGQHFHNPTQFAAYYDRLSDNPDLWTPKSVRHMGWKQLDQLGLMNAGGWDGTGKNRQI